MKNTSLWYVMAINLEKVEKGKYLDTVFGKELVIEKDISDLFGADSLTVRTIIDMPFPNKKGIMESEYFDVSYGGEKIGSDEPFVSRNVYFEGDLKYDKLNLLRGAK